MIFGYLVRLVQRKGGSTGHILFHKNWPFGLCCLAFFLFGEFLVANNVLMGSRGSSLGRGHY